VAQSIAERSNTSLTIDPDLREKSFGGTEGKPQLRARAASLADADAKAYGAVIAAYDSVRGSDDVDMWEQLRVALTCAAEVPLEVAESGAEAARMAARLAVEGKRDVRGDAATALLLAEAATRTAAGLVAINVEAGGGDPEFVRRTARCVTTARDAAAAVEQDGERRRGVRPRS